MDTALWGIIGIIVTIITSFIVLFGANNARKERERHATKEIVTILANILSQGQNGVDSAVVESLIKSKARTYNINISIKDVLPKIAEDLVTRFSESEFVTPEIKGKLVERALSLKEQLSTRKPMLKEIPAYSQYKQGLRYRYRRNVILATISALVSGTIVVIVSLLIASPETDIKTVSLFIVSIILIITILTYIIEYRQLREGEAETNENVNRILERTVADAIPDIFKAYNITHQVVVGNHIVDFIAEKDNIKLPIEVKSSGIDINTIRRMLEIMQAISADAGVIITSSPIRAKIRKTALKNNIFLIDNVTVEDDISLGLSNIAPM